MEDDEKDFCDPEIKKGILESWGKKITGLVSKGKITQVREEFDRFLHFGKKFDKFCKIDPKKTHK